MLMGKRKTESLVATCLFLIGVQIVIFLYMETVAKPLP